MAKSDDRITELEIELADMRAQLAELTRPAPAPTQPPKPRAVEEQGARVYHVAASNRGFIMPSDAELDQLRAIVVRAVPTLKPQKDIRGNEPDDDIVRGDFKAAVRAVSTLPRQDTVDHGKGVDFWVNHLNDQQRVAGRASIDAQMLIAAALALNTRHCIPLASASFGLTLSASTGKLPTDEWKAVLANGRIRGPDALPGEYGQWSMGGTSVRSG